MNTESVANVNALIYNVGKKDDDSKAWEQNGAIYIETSENMDQFSSSSPVLTEDSTLPPPPDSALLLEQASVGPLPDTRVQVIYEIFLVHSAALLLCIVFGMPFYFRGDNRTLVIAFLIVACVLFVVAYCSMLMFRRHIRIAIPLYSLWVVSCIIIVGCSANLMGNIAPFQLVAILLIESLTVIIYTKVTPSSAISSWHAFVYMMIGGLLMYGLSIIAFISDHDWVAGIVIFIVSVLCALYQCYQIRATEGRYSSGWDDVVVAVIQFYCDPILILIDKIFHN